MHPKRASRPERSSARDSSSLIVVITREYLSGRAASGCLAPVNRMRAHAVNYDVVEALPRPDLRLVERGRERWVAFRDELHGALHLFGLHDALRAAEQHHAQPEVLARHLFDLKADLVVGGDEFGLRPLGGEEE